MTPIKRVLEPISSLLEPHRQALGPEYESRTLGIVGEEGREDMLFILSAVAPGISVMVVTASE